MVGQSDFVTFALYFTRVPFRVCFYLFKSLGLSCFKTFVIVQFLFLHETISFLLPGTYLS